MSDAENEFSMNWTVTDPRGISVQITVRRPKLEDWPVALQEREKIMAQTQKDGWSYPGPVKATVSAPSAAVATPAAPKPVTAQAAPVAPAASGQFAAELLVSNMNEGKWYWKVKGGQYTKFGVTIWPETLDAAGLEHENGKSYNMTGWTAHYVAKPDGKPDKIIKLVAPVAVAEPF